jgi:Rrf2 family protein
MATSTRFAVGVHLLTALAANSGKILRSEDVADSANTNPVVVRRLFSLMTSAGLIRARLGPGGGFELARPAEEITLRDVFTALESGELFTEHRSPPSASCRVGAHILPVSARGDGARGRGSAGGAFAHDDRRYRRRRPCSRQRGGERKK